MKIGIVEATNSSEPANSKKSQNFRNLADDLIKTLSSIKETLEGIRKENAFPFLLFQNRCFLGYSFVSRSVGNFTQTYFSLLDDIILELHCMLHLPGFRGNPQR